MKLVYPFRVWSEDGVVLIQGLPPLDNVATYGDNLDAALANAAEALTGVLASILDSGLLVPDPAPVIVRDGDNVHLVEPMTKVVVPILLRKAREAAGLNQGELAARLGVTYQAVQKWERPGANPTLATVDRVIRALGRRLELELV